MTDERDPLGPRTLFCARCNSGMKSAIQAHGLWARVSKSQAELRAREAKRDPYDPDPMIVLHNMLMGHARNTAAMNGVTMGQVSTQCPVCFFGATHWIEQVAATIAKRFAALDQQKLDDIAHNERLNAAQA